MNNTNHSGITKLYVILTLVLITITCYSCHKESDETGNMAMLQGKWNWVKSVGGFAGQTNTPTSTGSTAAVEFTADSIFSEYSNGKMLYKTGYKIVFDQKANYWLISFNNQRSGFYVSFINRHKLILWDYTSDAFESTYSR